MPALKLYFDKSILNPLFLYWRQALLLLTYFSIKTVPGGIEAGPVKGRVSPGGGQHEGSSQLDRRILGPTHRPADLAKQIEHLDRRSEQVLRRER